MKSFVFCTVVLSAISLMQSAPFGKYEHTNPNRKNVLVTADEDAHKDTKQAPPGTRSSLQSIAEYDVKVNGSDLVLQKETPQDTIIISSKIPAIALRNPIDPEKEICDQEGSFNIELKRGDQSLMKILCLTKSFLDENNAFALHRFGSDETLNRSSINDFSNIFRFSYLTDDRLRQILKDKNITPDLIENMQNVANKYQ